MKKFISAVITLSMTLAFAVIPARAETFSNDNWAQYERGFYTSTDKFNECLKVTADTSYDDGQITSVRMVANTSSKVTSTKNPVAYKYGQNAADYGVHENDTATYAHMRLYLATFDDANHNMFDDFYLRMDKDGTGSSRDAFYFDNWKWDGEVYALNYTTSAAYTTKDWCGILKQGYNGNGPSGSTAAADCDSPTRVLSDSDYNKLDIIVEYNKQAGATTYLFVDGKFMADYYDSGLTDKHFHGIVFRTLENKTPRNNSSYIAVKFDPSRIGHREYYNTENYMVTLEDVMQDAGLGAENIDSTMIYKTKAGDLEWYMPGNNQVAYHYPNKLIDGSTASARLRIGENITYSGTAATITASNTGSSYEMAARMLAGFYPINGKCGVSYEDYHPRAKYIKLSFDQTISNDGMWLEYASYYSGKVQAIQMWNNDGYLVASVNGSGTNVTCNGAGNKPTADITGTNHIDWILEPNENDGCVYQHLYINGRFVASGNFGNQYAVRTNDIILSTKSAAGTVTIDNWSMTVYNDTVDISDIGDEILVVDGDKTIWLATGTAWGDGANADKFKVYAKAKTGIDQNAEGAKLYTAIYNGNKLLDVSENPYISCSRTETRYFEKSYDGTEAMFAKLFLWRNGEPISEAKYIPISEETVSAEVMRVKNNAKSIITIIHDDGSSSTANYLNREFAKHNLVGTVGIIGTNINTTAKVNTWTNILNESNGRMNFASHSYNHRYFGESDNAESGTLKDGSSYSYPAGHMTEDIANERARINGLFPNERVLTFIKPGTSYPEGKEQVSSAAMTMIQDHYIAMRNTGGNVDTIPPANYYSVNSLMAKPEQDKQYWINLLSSAVNKKGMLVYLFHGIKDADTVSGNDVKQSDVSSFFDELENYVADGRVWNAKFDEAIQYMREYGALTGVEAINHMSGRYITVSVTDGISRIDTDITSGKYAGRDMYDYPLTVKTEIPYNWEYVKLTQSYDNRVEILKTFVENGTRYVYANVVPDEAAAVLTEATSNDYVSTISYGGVTVANFDPATFYYSVSLPSGTASAPTITANKGSITQATLSGGEGSGFVTYEGIKYEIHFSVE